MTILRAFKQALPRLSLNLQSDSADATIISTETTSDSRLFASFADASSLQATGTNMQSQSGVQDPVAPILDALDGLLHFIEAVLSAISRMFTRARNTAKAASRFALWVSRPRQLRNGLVWLLALIMFAQPNFAIAKVISEATPAERAFNARLAAAMSKSNSHSTGSPVLTFLASNLVPVVSTIKEALDLVFPFDSNAPKDSPNSRRAIAPPSPRAVAFSFGNRAVLARDQATFAELEPYLAPSVTAVAPPVTAAPQPVLFQSSSPVSVEAAITKKVPNLNGGIIEGNLRVFEGRNYTISGGFQLGNDMFAAGTPTIRINGNSTHGEIVDDGGTAAPAYEITLNGNNHITGKIHIHANAISLPSDIPTSVPAPAGTRNVSVNSANDVAAIGDWATVRDLTVNGSDITVNVPPGNYHEFTVSGSSHLNFSNGTYNLQTKFIVNGSSSIQAGGNVVITTGQSMTFNGGAVLTLDSSTSSSTVKLNVLGAALTLNGNTSMSAFVRAPDATVTLNGSSNVRGQVIADQLVMNGNGKITGDSSLPSVEITSPANNSTTAEDKIVVSGRASDIGTNASGIRRVTVNGVEAVYNSSAGTWAIANVPLTPGANTIVARAEDNFGNQATAQITVTRNNATDTTPPALAITSPASGFETQADHIAISGTVSDPPPNASGIASVKINGTDAVRDVLAGTWTLASFALAVGNNTINAVATDNAGNSTTRSITVIRRDVPPVDSTPPVVTITSPHNNDVVFTSSITVTGTADDLGANASGVSRVFVNGVEATYDAGSHTWTAAGVAVQDGDNHIVAEAEDRAPVRNTGRAEVTVRRRIVASPQLTITNPLTAAIVSSSSITVAGSVSSGASDIPVTVKVNDQEASIAGGQYTRTVNLTDGANTITVVATDSLNQTATASRTVTRDQTSPTIVFASVPATVQAGGSYPIHADANDNIGVAAVDFSVNGQPAATATAAPFDFTLTVPANAAADSIITITAVARDLAGATSTDTIRTRVAGPGGISGFVFDDATGYGIESVAVIGAPGATGSDRTGSFNFVSSMPSGLVRFAKADHTPVERSYTVASGRGTSLFDGRLTRLDAQANSIPPSGGTGSGNGGRFQVAFASGSFTSATDIRITSISPQGLINLLPFGWSPVPGAVIDIRPQDGSAALGSFAAPAHLTISQTQGLAENTRLVLARYNETSHVWIVVNANILTSANGALAADLPALGQFAFLVADSAATAPPSAVASQPLPASAAAESSVLDNTTATAVASPRTAIISPDARSTISFLATSTGKLPSGLAIEATFDETYNLLTDSNPLLVDRPAQDFVLYEYPAATAAQPFRLGAFFVAKPTRADFTLAQLRTANIHIEIRAGRPSATGVLIGANGGEVTTDSGAKLEIPAGSLTSDTPVFMESVSPDLSGLQLPPGFDVIGVVDVDVASVVLGSSAALSIPSVTGDSSRIVVARLVTAAGRRSPKVVARAIDSGGRLRSATSGAGIPAGISLSGVTVSGRYVFIRIASAFGYLKGVVNTGGATPSAASMVRVAVDRTPFVDVTSSDGRYLTLGATSSPANGLDGVSLVTDATGTASASLAAQDSVADTTISIASVPLAVLAVSPGNSATSIVVTSQVTVTFSKPVAPSSLTGSTFRLSTASGNPVLGVITVLAGNRVAVFTPSSTLAGSTSYGIALSTAVFDLYGNALASPFTSSFTTASVVPVDDRLKPEKIQIAYPNTQGFSTVVIPAGSVPVGSVIVVINNTSGATITTVAGTAAISLQILAQVGDEIVVIVRQPDGTEYRVSQGAYRRGDGFVSVGRNGGAVTSDDGALLLAVPKGAISGQADLKLVPKVESEISIPRQGEMDPANVPFGGGVEIRAQGTFTVLKELHLELPAPSTAQEGQRVAFMKTAKITEGSQQVDTWESVTSGRVEGGKFKTSSPPFFGLAFLAPITQFWVFMPIRMRAVFGTVSELTSATDSTKRPVASVLCILGDSTLSGFANHVTARTNSLGVYGIFEFAVQFPASTFVNAIDDTNGRRGIGTAAPTSTVEARFLQGLQGFELMTTNIVLPARSTGGGSSPPEVRLTAKSTGISGVPENDPLVQFGTVQVPSTIDLLVVTNPVVQEVNGQVLIGGVVNQQLAWHQGSSDSPDWTAMFQANTEGSYSVVITATTQAGNPTTSRRVTYNFIALRNPNTRPPLEGPPSVLTATPASGASNVDVATDVRIQFSEPVHNLIAGVTVYLIKEGEPDQANNRIGGTILSGGLAVQPDSPNISNIAFKPSSALIAATRYCLHVTTEVRDTNDTRLDQEYLGQGDVEPQPFVSCFGTFQGFVLSDPIPDPGFRVVVSGSYAITLFEEQVGRSTVTIYDISDPLAPAKKSSIDLPQRGTDIAVADDQTYKTSTGDIFSRIAAITTHNLLHPEQQANVWLLNLDDVNNPRIAGVTSLYIVQDLPTTPLSVRIEGRHAYVGNAPYRGVIEVDIARAVEYFAKQSEIAAQLGNPQQPILDAVAPGRGSLDQAKSQSIRYFTQLTTPSAATSLGLLEQEVSSPAEFGTNNPRGTMNVAYAANSGAKQLVSLGFSKSLDHINDFLDAGPAAGPPRGVEQRVLAMKSVTPSDSQPMRVRTVAKFQVGNQKIDLALALGANRLWIFNVNNPTNPLQYPSHTWAEMGLQEPGVANYFEIEDTIAYVGMGDRVALIDFSDPSNPRVIATITGLGDISALAVKDGFVYSLSRGGGALDGLSVSIGRPASVVFIHGFSATNSSLTCANPVIIDRTTGLMKQQAEVFFQIFGHSSSDNQRVIIRKGSQTLADIPATPMASHSTQVVSGRALWPAANPQQPFPSIDLAVSYTAEVVIDKDLPTEYHSKPEPIPFSFLINDYQRELSAEVNDPLYSINNPIIPSTRLTRYAYVLGGTSNVVLKINNLVSTSVQLRNNGQRPLGLNVEDLGIKSRPDDNPLAADIPMNLEPGQYPFTLTATLSADSSVSDQVQGTLTVARKSSVVRPVGQSVVEGVVLFSGNLGLSYTDLEIRNRGLSLAVTRAYNTAGATAFGSLGYGWRHNYQMTLIRQQSSFKIEGGDGEGQIFSQASEQNGVMTASAPHHSTLVRNSDGSFDYFTKGHIRHHFPGAFELDSNAYFNLAYMGNLDYIEEPNGNRIDLEYDGLGRMVSVIDSSGRALEYHYQPAQTPFVGLMSPLAATRTASSCVPKGDLGLIRNRLLKAEIGTAWRISSITGPGGLEIDYAYDALGNLTGVTRKGDDAISDAAVDSVWQYSYKPEPPSGMQTASDLTHTLKSVTTPNGNTTAYDYWFDKVMLPVRTVTHKARLPEDDITNAFAYTLDASNIINQVAVTDGRQNVTTYKSTPRPDRPEKGYDLEINAPRNATTLMKFDEFGLESYQSDPEGTTTTSIHDANGNPTTETVQGTGNSGITTTITTVAVFNLKFNKPSLTADANGNPTTYDLDANGNVKVINLPTTRKIQMEYAIRDSDSARAGDLIKITDQRGLITTFEYDAFGNQSKVTRDTGSQTVITTSSYDERSRLLSTQNTIGPSFTYGYDGLDRVSRTDSVDPTGFRESLRTTYSYKPAGQLQRSFRQTLVNDVASGPSDEITYGYDEFDRNVTVAEATSDAGAFDQILTYDHNSNLTSQTDRRGVKTSYVYDPLNFLTQVKAEGPFGPSEIILSTVTKDRVGNTLTMLDMYGQTVNLKYDGLHRLRTREYVNVKGDSTGNYTESVSLDSNGNVIISRDRNNHLTTILYDQLNRPKKLIDAVNRQTEWEYDDSAGSVTMRKIPQSLSVTTQTDALERLVSQEVSLGSNHYSTSYRYTGRTVEVTDPRGDITRRKLSGFGEPGEISVEGMPEVLPTEMRYSAFGGLKSYKDANGRRTTFTVDVLNRTRQATYPQTSGRPAVTESWTYDGENNLTSHSDRRGISSSMTYDNLARALKTVIGGIEVQSVAYGAPAPGASDATQRRKEAITDAGNHTTDYLYDGLHRLIEIKDANLKSKTLDYDGVNLIAESDFRDAPNGGSKFKTLYEYDDVNRLTKVTDRTSSHITVVGHNDSGGHQITTTDRRAKQRVEVYDPLERLTRVESGGQLLARYEYDGNNNRTAMEDGRGNHTTFTYDRANRLKTASHENIQLETYTYDGVGNVLSYNDGFGGNITQSFDSLDHLILRTDGEGNSTRYNFDGEGLLREKTEPKGNTAATSFTCKYDYNDLRSLTRVTDAAGRESTYGYDNDQNLTSLKDALLRTTGYEYDSLHRLTKVVQPQNVVTNYEYDANGNTSLTVDPKGQRLETTYDALDRPSLLKYPNATGFGPREYSYTYDPEGNLTDVREQALLSSGLATRGYSRTYDDRNRLESATDPLGHSVRYAYDGADNVVTLTDSASKQTGYTYDRLNRLETVSASGRTVNYSWNPDGLLQQVNYGNGMSRAYDYDRADRVRSITNTFGSSSSEQFVYGYDANSNRDSETRKLNGQIIRNITNGYDDLDRLTQASYSSAVGRGLQGDYFDSKDFTSLKVSRIDPTVAFTWPGAGTPDPRIADNTFSVRWTGKVQPQFSETYTFYVQSDEGARLYVNNQLVVDDFADHASQERSGTLSLQAGQKYDIKLEYFENTGDAEVKLSWSSASQAKQVVPESALYPADSSLTYTYDAVGNRKTETGTDVLALPVSRSYNYDDLNRLTEITGDPSGAATFAHDPNGNLRTKSQAGVTTTFDYDVRDQLRRVAGPSNDEIAGFDYDFQRRRLTKTSGGIPLNYVYAGDRVVNEYGASSQLVNRYDYGADLLRGELGGEGERFYFSDAVGSVTALAQGGGGLATRNEYDAWGERLLAQPTTNRIGYTGQYRDEETGLMPLGNGERYYSPGLGQFIQQDGWAGALASPQTINRHSYALSNPNKFADPSGNLPILIPVLGLLAAYMFAETGYNEAEARRMNSRLSRDQAPSSWALGISDATGMTSAFRSGSGVDPYTARDLTGGERVLEGVIGAAGLLGTATGIAGSLSTGAGLARGAAAEFSAARGGLRGIGNVGRSAARGLGRSIAGEWAGTLGELRQLRPFAATRFGQQLGGSRLGRALGAADEGLYAAGRAIGGKITEGYRGIASGLESLTPQASMVAEGAGAIEGFIKRAANADRYARQAGRAADEVATTADDLVRGATKDGMAKFRDVEVSSPQFDTLEERLAYGERFQRPQEFIDEFVSDLKGNVRLSAKPRYDLRLSPSGSAIVAEGQEAIKIGQSGLIRDSELFKTVFHEEGHLRLMTKARRGNPRALDLVTHPNEFLEEQYVENIAIRYLRRYERAYGPLKH